jgi:hypothetical protein
MTRRIVFWAVAGLVVAIAWAVYAMFYPSPAVAYSSGTWTLIEITCPAAVLGRMMPLKIYWFLLLNAVAYALADCLFKFLRQVRFDWISVASLP